MPAKMHVYASYIVQHPSTGTHVHGSLQRPGKPRRPWEAVFTALHPSGFLVLGEFTPAEVREIRKQAVWAVEARGNRWGVKKGSVYFVN